VSVLIEGKVGQSFLYSSRAMLSYLISNCYLESIDVRYPFDDCAECRQRDLPDADLNCGPLMDFPITCNSAMDILTVL